MENRKGDMTRGKPLPKILRFALPMITGAIFQQLYNLVDMIVVGNANGSLALAAVGATGSTIFMLTSLAYGLTDAFTTVIAQYFGADDTQTIRKTITHAIYVTAGCALMMMLIGLFCARPFMNMLNTPADIIDDAVLYIQICIGGSAGMLIYTTSSSILRAVGNSRIPLFFLIFSSILNVGLDLLFVLQFGMGVKGVAIATVISQTLSGIICTVYMVAKYEVFRPKAADFALDAKLLKYILKLGLTSGVQSMILGVSDMFISRAVNGFGSDVVAAYSACGRVMNLTMMFCMTMARAFTVYAGQNFGAREFGRIREGFRKTLMVVTAMSLLFALGVFIFGGDLIRLFINSADSRIDAIVDIAVGNLHVHSCGYIFLGLIWLYNNTLRGLGDVWVPFISSMIEIVTKIAVAYLLGAAFGYFGLWFAWPAAWILGVIPPAIRFHSSAWEKLADRFGAKSVA